MNVRRHCCSWISIRRLLRCFIIGRTEDLGQFAAKCVEGRGASSCSFCLRYPAGVTSAWLQGRCCVMTINSHFGRRTGPEITARASFRRTAKAFTARVQARMNTPGAHQAAKRAIVCHSEKTALLECLHHLPIAVDEAWVDAAASIVDDRVYCMSEQPDPSFHFVLEPLELALAPDHELAQIHKEHP